MLGIEIKGFQELAHNCNYLSKEALKKGPIGIGGSYGCGALICRSGANHDGPWGAPAIYALEGGNIGFQLGGQATDFVLLIMNDKRTESVLSDKVKLSADSSSSAGVKRSTALAETDIVMKAEILSYSRSWGLFSGISPERSTLRSDGGANKSLYGKELSAKDIVLNYAVKPQGAASSLASVPSKKSPQNHSSGK
jgi:SH3 domain-containing YSC84-like protein 1